jgi:hypothetical protein
MPKVIYANDDDDRNYVKDSLEMAKLGASVVGSIQGIEANKQAAELAKVQSDKTKAEFEEWNSPEQKGMRQAQVTADTETAKTTASTQFDKRRITIGTGLAQHEEQLFGDKADKTIPFEQRRIAYSDYLNRISGGDLSVQTAPKMLEDGTQVQVAKYVRSNGETLGEFEFTGEQDFRQQAAGLRHSFGYYSQDVIDAYDHSRQITNAFNQLSPQERATVGNDSKRLQENPDLLYKLENMIGGKKTAVEYDEDRADQDMQVTEHKDRMATNATNRAYYNEQRKIAREERDYKIKNIHPYEEAARVAQAQQNEAKLFEIVGNAAEEYWPELQPTYQTISTPGTESADPTLAALGVGGAQQKKTYTPQQQDALRFIQANINSLPQDMAMHQKFDALRDKYIETRKAAGVKATVFYTEDDGGGDNSKNGGNDAGSNPRNPDSNKPKPTAKPDGVKPPRNNTPSQAPQPFNGALGVRTPNANDLATDSARAQESRDAVGFGVRAITEGSMGRRQREENEELLRRNGLR